MAAPTTYLTVIKRFTYRADSSEEWSNSYALTGSTPSSSTAWRTLFDAMVAEEKKLYTPATSVIAGYGYDKIPATGDSAIWTVDMTVAPNTVVPGTLTAGGTALAGDQAVWVRWGLDRFNSKGKRIYLRKYFHGGQGPAGGGDPVLTGYNTALVAFGNKLWDGTFADSRKICDKLGNTPIGSAVTPYITTRTLKRRGKRPPA